MEQERKITKDIIKSINLNADYNEIERLIYNVFTDQKKKYSSVAYEFLVLLQSNFDQTLEDLRSRKFGWDLTVFKEDVDRLQKIQEEKVALPEFSSSENNMCGRCKSYKVLVIQVQTKAGDEGVTNRYTCLNCQNKWSKNN